ncbi:MAG: hypothetical protein AB1938_04535 [Myxococcota bacterium]
MAVADYEVSAHYASSLAKVLERQRLLHVCPCDALALLENPWASRWWPGSVVESALVAVRREFGDEALHAVGDALLQQHMTPGLVPAISWLISLAGVRPSALLSRLDVLAATLLRGVRFEWQADGRQAGVVRVHYPGAGPDPQVRVEVWRGIFQQVFTVTHHEGSVDAIAADRGVVEARLAWQ